jgi:periplasmic protein CpxP/Spy
MKKLNVFVPTLVVLVLSSAVFSQASSAAQGDQQPQAKSSQAKHQEMMTPEAMVDHLSTELNLTEDQRTKIKPIAEDVYKRMNEVRQDSSIPEQERREKMKQIHENGLSQAKPILTADQQKKLDEMMSSHSHKGSTPHQHQ